MLLWTIKVLDYKMYIIECHHCLTIVTQVGVFFVALYAEKKINFVEQKYNMIIRSEGFLISYENFHLIYLKS